MAIPSFFNLINSYEWIDFSFFNHVSRMLAFFVSKFLKISTKFLSTYVSMNSQLKLRSIYFNFFLVLFFWNQGRSYRQTLELFYQTMCFSINNPLSLHAIKRNFSSLL